MDSIAPSPMLPGILLLNAKYFPASETSAAKVGATSFAFSVAHVLQDAGLFAGMILYQRREDLTRPHILLKTQASFPCATLGFNFGMRRVDIRDAIASATEMLLVTARDVGGPAILYHQTDTLLAYSPEWLPSCVTHHGPFYDDFIQHFGREQAAVAFGSQDKAQHLRKHQRIGLNHLRQSKNMFVLQHSSLQRNYLMRHDIAASRIHRISPPISATQLDHLDLTATHPQIAAFIGTKPSLLLFTAVARLDFFKNVELLVDAGIELLRRGVAVRVLIAGGDETEQCRRAGLIARVPAGLASDFMAVPKLSKDGLYALFDAVKNNSFFVCPSRYETLGITPLEAALSSVPTLIVDSPNVEASCYFPPENRFRGSASSLAHLIQRLQEEGMHGRGDFLCRTLENQISHDNFKQSLLRAWTKLSNATAENTSPVRCLQKEVVQLQRRISCCQLEDIIIMDAEMDGVRLGSIFVTPELA
ncbi:hypothetical protein BUE80_DR003912 [Diplocarpon rosae]|nr:hypothetical protein BUE80_DR003912 [Diplocarpon rosae]